MPIYPFACLHEMQSCGRNFELNIPLGIYDQHRAVEFRDVQCPHCYRRGARRTWNPGDGPNVHTMYGQFDQHHHSDLVGKTFSSREEYNRMLRSVGEDPESTNTISVAETGRSRQHGVAKSGESKKVGIPDRVAAAKVSQEGGDVLSRLTALLGDRKGRKAAILETLSQEEFDAALGTHIVKHGGGWYSLA